MERRSDFVTALAIVAAVMLVMPGELAGGGEEILQIVEPGGYFGELAPMFGLQRAASARAGDGGAVLTGYTLRDFRGRQAAGL